MAAEVHVRPMSTFPDCLAGIRMPVSTGRCGSSLADFAAQLQLVTWLLCTHVRLTEPYP